MTLQGACGPYRRQMTQKGGVYDDGERRLPLSHYTYIIKIKDFHAT